MGCGLGVLLKGWGEMGESGRALPDTPPFRGFRGNLWKPGSENPDPGHPELVVVLVRKSGSLRLRRGLL